MTKKQPSKKKYIRHSSEFKQEALKLAEQSSVSLAAKQLGLHDSKFMVGENKQSMNKI